MDLLLELKKAHSVIGDVRGYALFFGIEFVLAGESKEPATTKAKYVVDRMLDHRILTSLDGPGENVMKIKPPMCITEEEVGYFMEVMEKVVGEDVVRRDS